MKPFLNLEQINFNIDLDFFNLCKISYILEKEYFINNFSFINVMDFFKKKFDKHYEDIYKGNILTKDEEYDLFSKISKYLYLIYFNIIKIPLVVSNIYYIYINKKKEGFNLNKIDYDFFKKYNQNVNILCNLHNKQADELLLLKFDKEKIELIDKKLKFFNFKYCIHENIILYILIFIDFYKIHFNDFLFSLNLLINLISIEEKNLLSIFKSEFDINKDFFLKNIINVKLNKFFLIFIYYKDNINYKYLKFNYKKILNIINNLIKISNLIGIDILNFKIIIWNILINFINYNVFRNKILQSNLKLAISIAYRFYNTNIEMCDLIQESNIGLMKAIDKFDFFKGYKFSTYATWWIRQSINRFFADYSRTIRLPVHVIETINKVNKFIKENFESKHSYINMNIVSKRLKIPLEKLNKFSLIQKEPISIDNNLKDSKSFIRDFIESKEKDLLNTKTNKQLKLIISDLFNFLDEREKKILYMRFGIGYDKTYTLESIGKIFGVTRERIRQIESKALLKLRSLNIDYLKDFININN